MLATSSTLVETVSINYEDFNESFLTCGTCLCMYDGGEHTPKLLQCSHTVCLHCLSRIAAQARGDSSTFRCPICRELITIPRGGVAALPPSFLVNQLLDLMSRQRREVIPKCSVHINQELLFCETCDAVFCSLCTGSGHHGNTGAGAGAGQGQGQGATEHTIIPFSIAIKRMSEILLYKANQCISKLSEAEERVRGEVLRLEQVTERTREQVIKTMKEAAAAVEHRKQDLLLQLAHVSMEKRKVLDEQLTIIEAEKNKVDKETGRLHDGQVERECEGLQYQVEVRNITQRVASLADKLDAAASLSDPRENSFLTCDFAHNDALTTLPTHLSRLGRVRASTTFPSLCTWHMEDSVVVAHLQSSLLLHTVDFRGDPRNTGGDPVSATLVKEDTSTSVAVNVTDLDDGTYRLTFRPTLPGKYLFNIRIFDRVLRDCPIVVDVNEHNNPVKSFGSRGAGKDGFLQPVAVAVDRENDTIYVVDTGNSRIKVLTKDLEFIRHIENEGLEGRSCTGIDICKQGIVIANWRTKTITTMDYHGTTQSWFSYNGFQEPVDVSVDKEYGHYLVADIGASAILVFDANGRFLFQVGKPGLFNLISSVCVGQNAVLVADTKIQIFSAKGDFLGDFGDPKDKGRFGGLCVDGENRIIATRKERNRNVIQIISWPGAQLISTIDSNDIKLKRTGGVAITSDYHVVVVDLAHDCIRKYRYY